MTVRIKICCISSVEEARTAVRHGASALGLVSAMPSGPGVIADDLITEISSEIPPGVASFLLTSLTDVEAVVRQQRRCRVNTLQLCDALEDSAYAYLRRHLPGVGIVQVIHVRGPESVTEAMEVAPKVDAILLDSGNPGAAVKELGGTGRRHDWSVSRRIRDLVGRPVYLAGGLNSGNITEALETVQPFGVDLCTGVRTNGRLDETKLGAFFEAVRSAGGA
jgi:phosphoribosylanthranilate isomerase